MLGLTRVNPQDFAEEDRPFVQMLAENGYLAVRKLPDNTWAGVLPMGHNMRLTKNVDWSGVSGNYCYARHKLDVAIAGLNALTDADDDPPPGWHRHVESGRRRTDGDPATEVVYW